jgi:hypothetical protein
MSATEEGKALINAVDTVTAGLGNFSDLSQCSGMSAAGGSRHKTVRISLLVLMWWTAPAPGDESP